MSLKSKKILGIVLLVISVALLIPGLTLDILTLKVSFNMSFLGSSDLYKETKSILGTIGSLFEAKNYTVAFLIFFFSVLVPGIKIILLSFTFITPGKEMNVRINYWVNMISKWAMADVFVVGVFIAFLSTGSNENVKAYIHSGFWYFTFYCLASLFSSAVSYSYSKDLNDLNKEFV